ncbi:cytochrome c oxidase subunit II [Fundidesulfovibrio agrisoli]|uniref:cytochrome c oxidase subunit II n=1 Tax=Fundidesulfovibrio agrisoli TaxID=2922717 RepID=UPI001FAD1D9F|nr:cytochrome c oxidase subunit II [Fundidesulfovibrio agrisoli]
MNQAYDAVAGVDRTFLIIFVTAAALLVMVTITMIFFVVRYDRRRNPVPSDIDGNLWAEIAWTVIPTLIVLALFHYGWTSYQGLRTVPPDAMEVSVTARMWSWSFSYDGGRHSDVLVVPVGRAVKLNITSKDVIHGVFVPAFRIKVDAVPGMTTHAWFRAEKPGEYDLFCSVYCGLKHADMHTTVRAVSEEEFKKWLAEAPAQGVHPGKALLERYGCLGCHTLDGSESVGPTLKGIAGTKVVLVTPKGVESTVTVDAAYLKEAIAGKKEATMKGFDPLMPSFGGQIPEADIDQMVDYLLKGDQAAPPDGAAIAESQGCTGCHSTDGSVIVGPSFKGLMGSVAHVAVDGAERDEVVNRAYVLDVLSHPEKHRVKGFDPIMPAYPQLTEQEKQALLNYLESLANAPEHGGPEQGGHEHQTHEGHK